MKTNAPDLRQQFEGNPSASWEEKDERSDSTLEPPYDHGRSYVIRACLMASTVLDYVPTSAIEAIRDVDSRISALQDEKRAIVAKVTQELAWMDIPIIILQEHEIELRQAREPHKNSLDGATYFHLIRQLDEGERGYSQWRVHRVEACPEVWCSNIGRQKRAPYSRPGRGHLFTFAGVYREIAKLDEAFHVMPVGNDAVVFARELHGSL